MAGNFDDVFIPFSVGTELRPEREVLENLFGGNYTQRTDDGINAESLRVNVEWNNKTLEQINALNDFLRPRFQVETFDWTLRVWGETSPRRWRCVDLVGPTPQGSGQWSLVAEFVEEFGE